MKIALIVPDLFRGDGVGNDVLGMARALRLRHSVRIVCANCEKDIEHTRVSDYLKNPQDDDLIIYHYAVEWDAGDKIFTSFNGRRILRYHNVTPPELLRSYNRAVADACQRGRERLRFLPVPDLLLADSRENAADYISITGRSPAVEILAPFSQTELLLSQQNNKKLETRLQQYSGLRLLYVGRISPHKNVHALIEEIDEAVNQENVETFTDRDRIADDKASAHGTTSRWRRLWMRLRKSPGMMNRRPVDRSRSHPVLWIAGSFSPAFPEYNRMVRRAASRCRSLEVVFLNGLSLSELATLYRMADLFVTASLHEGFCVPIVESMAFDLPMLLPDLPIFRETSLEQAQYFTDLKKSNLPGKMTDKTEITLSEKIKKVRTHDLFLRHYSSAVLESKLLKVIQI